MARILAIDYGKKRTGLAVCDPLQIIASGLKTVDTKTLVWELKQYFAVETVEKVLLGYPTNLNGSPTDITAKVEQFHEQFKKIFPHIPIQLCDERYTSKMAFQSMIDSGMKKSSRQNKALIDEISAQIILQGYLDGQH